MADWHASFMREKNPTKLLAVLSFFPFSICSHNSSVYAIAHLFKNTYELLAF